MRLFILAIVFTSLISSAALAQTPQPIDFSGTWTFTWDNDNTNTNSVVLKHAAGTITGTYTNDSRESCPVVGRVAATALIMVIMCPGWDIKGEGVIESATSVSGQYLAYGDSTGDFKLTRQ